ncbi:MAG: glycosyltransferase, partial [Verrucomicrobiaceae bacterium]|nr:glycosyltransferase [Verrucomicrobiaceae bacterium]
NADATAARRERVLSGAPLRVLMVGSFSYRKGILDLKAIAGRLGTRFVFRFVGDVPAEGRALKEQLGGVVEFKERVPPQKLADEYAWGDVFLFPTIEDGFPAVLSQALASGLPVITTPHGSGPDLVRENITGWCVPARDAEAMIARLEWLNANRAAAVTAGEAAAASASERTWGDVAEDFVQAAKQRLITR